MRNTIGPVKENGVWEIRTIQELMRLCRGPNIISEIGKERLRRLGHVERVTGERTVIKMLKNVPKGKRCVG